MSFVKIRIEKSAKKTELLCAFTLEDSSKVIGLPKFDASTTLSISQSLRDTSGKLGKLCIVHTPGKKPIKRILLAGIGKEEEITTDTIRTVSGKIAQKARELKLKEFSIISPPSFGSGPSSGVTQIIEGAKMSLYKFDKFKSEKSDAAINLTIIVSKPSEVLKSAKKADIMIVIGGKNSSNSKELASKAKEYNVETHFIQSAEKVKKKWFKDKEKIGVTAGASTPKITINEDSFDLSISLLFFLIMLINLIMKNR